MTDDPGKKWVYNTGLPHILSGIITKTSKMSTFDFAQKYLFKPSGMNVTSWDSDGKGCYGGGSGLYLTPVDMAK
jgi:CubicO group peptidase (beta-lactamase class C family)